MSEEQGSIQTSRGILELQERSIGGNSDIRILDMMFKIPGYGQKLNVPWNKYPEVEI